MSEQALRAEAGGRWKRPWVAVAAVFAGFLVLFLSNEKPLDEVDCHVAPYVAWSMVTRGNFEVSGYRQLDSLRGGAVVVMADGRCYSKYPPGSAVAMLPVIGPLALVKKDAPGMSMMLRLGKFVASVCVAGAVALFFALCRRIAPGGAWAATVLLGAGTCLWPVASQAMWTHGPAVFWAMAALYGTVRWAERLTMPLSAGIGAALGMAVVCRQTTVVFAVMVIGLLVVQRRWRAAVVMGAMVGILGAGLAGYNRVCFGSGAETGYRDEASWWNSPLVEGLPGLLISPSRGMLVFSPALVFAGVGLWKVLRGRVGLSDLQRGMVVAWVIGAAVTVIAYAKWWSWWGGWSYGPRLLSETMPVWCLLVAFSMEGMGLGWRRVVWGLVGVSVAVQFLGVWGRDREWNARHETGASMFEIRDSQIEAHARKLLWVRR